MRQGYRGDSVLRCPFCERPMTEPGEIKGRFGNSFTGGACECGAVFVYDRSGHNLGDAYVDALTHACGGDWDKAWNLTPDEDYEIRELNYDSRRNKFSGGRRGTAGAFVFIRIKNSECREGGMNGAETGPG